MRTRVELSLKDIRAVVSDMDGVLWRSTDILPGAVDFFQFMRAKQIPFVLASNNSSRSPADYVAKIGKAGLGPVTEAEIVTSATTTADYLKAHYPQGTRVHVLGGSGLHGLVADAGFPSVDTDADVVVAGLDFDLTYDKLRRAALLIRAGADFIGTNDDVTFPSTEGLIPGAGSLLAALRAATDREPIVMGKPGRAMFETALRILGTAPEHTLMIGDRLNTDIAGAQATGMRTALVLSGVSTRDEAEAADQPPDAIFADLAALTAAWPA